MTRSKKAQTRAKNKYNKANTRTYCLRLNLKTDKDIIEILDSVKSKQGFIKGLIREDIKKRKPCNKTCNKKSVECIFCEWFQEDKSLGGYVCCAPEYIIKEPKKP